MPRNEFKAGDEKDDNPLEKEVLERFDRGDLRLKHATDEEVNVLIKKGAVTINKVREAKGQPTEGPRMICRQCFDGKHVGCLARDLCECECNKSSGLTTTEALVEEMRKKD